MTQRFKPGSVSGAELRSLAALLRTHAPATAHRHLALLQLAEAAVGALEGPAAAAWEALQREERQLLFTCAEGAASAAVQLSELCQLAAGSSGGDGSGSAIPLPDLATLVLGATCLLPDHLPW